MHDSQTLSSLQEAPELQSDLRFIVTGFRRRLLLLVALSLTAAFSEAILLAAILQAASSLGSGSRDTAISVGPVSWTTGVVTLLVVAAGLSVVRAIAVGSTAVLGSHLMGAARHRARSRLFRAYVFSDWPSQAASKSGHFMQSFSASVNELGTVYNAVSMAIPAGVTLVVLVAFSLVLDPLATGAMIVLGVAVPLLLRPVSRRGQAAAHADRLGRDDAASLANGLLGVSTEITVADSSHRVWADTDARVMRAEHQFSRANSIKRLIATAPQSVAFVAIAGALLAVAATEINVDYIALGTVAVLMLRAAGMAQALQTGLAQIRLVAPFVEQVREAISRYEASSPVFGSALFPDDATVGLHDVTFRYQESAQPVLRSLSATFPVGTATAVLGPSGSGKSTLIQVLLRLRPTTGGRITIGGIDITHISKENFGEHVAYVPQTAALVPGTVLDNIIFFRESISAADAERAAGEAHVLDELLRLPKGLDTVLDAQADGLSGGQKQRLVMARALAARPAILILDEPTSALDPLSEAAVLASLSELRGF